MSVYEIIYEPIVEDNSSWYTKNITYNYKDCQRKYKYLGTENFLKHKYDLGISVNKYTYDNSKRIYCYDGLKENGRTIYF